MIGDANCSIMRRTLEGVLVDFGLVVYWFSTQHCQCCRAGSIPVRPVLKLRNLASSSSGRTRNSRFLNRSSNLREANNSSTMM